MIPSGKKIYLCTPDLKPITVLNGLITNSVQYEEHVKDYDVLSFEVDRFININGNYVESNGYDDLKAYMNLYLEDIGCFQMQHPTVNGDGYKETKSIISYSLEKEFENKTWIGLKVNTGETDSLEQLAENNLDDLGFAKEFVKFYNPNRKDLSLLNLLLTKMDGWSVRDEDIDPLLWDLQLSFDEGNVKLYPFFTAILAPKAECIFLFDTIHRRIKAISKHSLDYDTNIFIGYRNLAKSIAISVEEDSVVTNFNCEGDNGLTVNNVNYNDSSIYDFSYFMCQPYMDDTLITKLQTWIDWRNAHREEFIQLNKDRADKEDKIYELKYRVPNDGDDWKQWDKMDEELLQQNLKYYNALLTSLQVSVDSNPQYDTDGNYIPWKKTDGSINHDAYLQLLYNQSNGYGGYYTYLEVNTYIIPNIEIAISNLGVPEDNKVDYVKDFETNWELYGIEELTAKKNAYEEQLTTLKSFSKSWSEMTDNEKSNYPGGEDEYNTLGRSKYVEISGLLGNETASGTLLFYLKKLNDELSNLQSELDTIDASRNEMVKQASMTHESYGFTTDDLIVINTLIHTKDYQNTNILSTSVDTTVTKIDREKELYDDSVNKLSEVCEPQFTFSVSLDNLLRIEEFKEWEPDCKLLRFIRLGIRDDYSVKLRIVGLSWNPCEITPDLTIEFSNMVTSRSGRSDLTNLLNSENNRGSNNSISIGTGNSDTDKEYLTKLLQLMISNNLFKSAVSNIAGNTTGVIDEAEIGRIVGNYAKFITLDVGRITGDEASFNKFFSTYIDTDYLVGNSAIIKNLDTDLANIKNAIIGVSSTETGIIINLTSANAVLDEAFIRDGIAAKMSIADLQAGNFVLTDTMKILSQNGKLVMDGTALQISGTDSNGNEYVGIQLGYDTTSNPSLILRNEDGAIILTPNGITENAIADKLIVNNMLGDHSVSKRNIDWTDISESVDENGNPIWNVSSLVMNGEKFEVQYTTFTESTQSEINKLSNDISSLSDMVQSVELTGSQVFVEDENGISPSVITITANIKNGLEIGKWYLDGIENTEYVSNDKMSISIPSTYMTDKKSVIVKVEGIDTSKYDIFSVYKVVDGSDAYTVVISSNNGNTFKYDSGVTESIVTCTVYKGADEVTPNSYTWYYRSNDGNWIKLVETGKEITFPLSTDILHKSLKCKVDI